MSKSQNFTESSYESILQQAASQRKIVFDLKKTYPAFIVLILFLTLSVFIWIFVGDKVQSDKTAAFEKANNSVMSRVELKVQNSYQVLQSMRGLYDNLVQVVRDYFVLYGSVPVKTYSSIISLMYVPKIDSSLLAEHIHFTQSQGLYDYKVYPTGNREFYMPAAFIVPSDKNMHISGYDLATNQITFEAINKAQKQNKMVSTPVFEFVRKDTNEILLISPIVHKRGSLGAFGYNTDFFEGVVILELNSKEFFSDALREEVPSDTSIIFEMLDKDFKGNESTIFTSKNFGLMNSGYKPELLSEKTLKIADREIKVRFSTIPNFGGQFQQILPLLSFIISLVLSFVLFGFVLVTTTRKAIAIDLAERMTRSQRRILDTSNDIIAVMDMNGLWKSMNPASAVVFGYMPEEMIGQNIKALCLDGFEFQELIDSIPSSNEDFTTRLDLLMSTKESGNKWLNFSFTVSKKDALIYSIGRDVTLEKLAEEEAKVRTKQIQVVEQYTRETNETRNYFIIKLSHKLRNSITSIIGYIQLLAQKAYDNQEEHDSYLQLANESSEDLFSFTSDLIEVVKGDQSGKDISRVSLFFVLNSAIENYKQYTNHDIEFNFELSDEIKSATAVANVNLLSDTFFNIFRILSINSSKVNFQISSVENPYEGVTDIQLICDSNQLLNEMITLFKEFKDSIFEALKNDKNDIMFNLAVAASNIRILNGTMTIDTLEPDNMNIVQITLPLNEVKI
ncbi:MAG: CHASE domain-containing protein [Ignavibacteriae bacterium]|nr:CHASE domain-containing protein [Ignavibacteriota bacterium]